MAEAALEEVQRRAIWREATAAKRGEAGRPSGKAAHQLPCVKDAVVAAHASSEQPALRSIAESEPLPAGLGLLRQRAQLAQNGCKLRGGLVGIPNSSATRRQALSRGDVGVTCTPSPLWGGKARRYFASMHFGKRHHAARRSARRGPGCREARPEALPGLPPGEKADRPKRGCWI